MTDQSQSWKIGSADPLRPTNSTNPFVVIMWWEMGRISLYHWVNNRVVVSVSTSRSRDGLETYQRLVSVSAIYVSCPRPCINSFLMGMQMAPYAVSTSFRHCKPML